MRCCRTLRRRRCSTSTGACAAAAAAAAAAAPPPPAHPHTSPPFPSYEALRDGIPDDGGGVRGGFAYKQNAGEIFENFFGTSNPFSDFGFGDSVPFATRVKRPGPRKADPVVNTMACTLEELYNGCVKKHNVTRQRYTPEGVLEADTKTVTITVKPGWKKGTKVTFPCEGDEAPNTIPADVVFVLSEAPHPSFARQGNDLVYTCNISLADALTDCALAVPTLDGRTLAIPCPEVVSPPYEKAIEGEGMPVSKRPGTKGNLVIRFKIAFPTYLSQEKKLVLRSMLAGSEAPPPPAVAAADEAAE
jgi:DnaJ-class molecular chaperone